MTTMKSGDAETESPKFEKAATRWLERYITQTSPSLREYAKVVVTPEERRANSY
jgi:hypothetical protein